jgi:dethiobiotin synthetase
MKAIFITGTDTGVGKTLVTGLMAGSLAETGHSVTTQKWVETGTPGLSRDVSEHLRLMGRKKKDVKDEMPHMSPYTFRFASSPHLAAAMVKKRINVDKIKEGLDHLSKRYEYVLAEGAGGALVPYNKEELVLDIANELGMPVVIVASNRLGAINHTLLTVEALRARHMEILGIVFNNMDIKANRNILKDNVDTIKRLSGVHNTVTLPFVTKKTDLSGIKKDLGGLLL